jgi:GTP cyclohydrolase I
MTANTLTRDERYDVIRNAFGEIMNALGLDLRDDSLEETPHRIAKMYVDEVFGGLDYSQFPKITLIENKMNVEEMVCVEDIDLTSTCEHHFVTIDGSAKVAYIPKNTVIGLSKINRLVRFFCSKAASPGAPYPANTGCHANVVGHRGCRGYHQRCALLRESARRQGRQ